MNEMDKRVINNLKSLGIDMINEANSGHPGIVLGAAPIMYALYKDHIRIDPKNPNWINRDRFVLSAGHGSALLYANLFMAGYDLNINDLKKFRQYGSKTPGHPELNVTPGVDVSTGPLGQGLATAVGMCIGAKNLAANLNIKNSDINSDINLIDYNTYVLCGDGDLMEGVSYEACSLAGKLKLDNLIVLYDSNNVTLDGMLDLSFDEDIIKRFESQNWHTITVKNGDDSNSISEAISEAKKVIDKPTIIVIKTIIGKDALKENTNLVHGSPLSDEDISQFKQKLNINEMPFYVDKDALLYYQNIINNRNITSIFNHRLTEKEFINTSNETTRTVYNYMKSKVLNINLNSIKYNMNNDETSATRIINGKVMNELNKYIPILIGGSADLSTSTKTSLNSSLIFDADNYGGKNIFFGVREHAMGAITNGLALSSLIPFSSTFLAFSDYLKPSIRMAALMNLFNIFIFTHDSISVGADGPTHQPVEQIAALRSIPNLNVYRPCDYNEVIGCWNSIINEKKPAVLLLSRTDGGVIKDIDSNDVNYGGYIVSNEFDTQHINIIATGSEVHLALELQKRLESLKIYARIISIPCVEKFLKQDITYRNSIITPHMKTFVIEASNDSIWNKFVYNDKYLFTVSDFGVSASKDEIYKHFNLDIDTILDKIVKLVK